MQNILVILDKPKHEQIALQRALELVQKLPESDSVKLHLVSFVYEPMQWLPFMGEHAKLIVEQIQSDRDGWLARLKDEHPLPENTVTESVWHHDIPAWVQEYLDGNPCDLVLKTAQKQHGQGGFGSIDWRLIEQLSVPLWLAVSTHWVKRDKVIAAMDPGLDNELHMELNQRLLDNGGTLAKTLGAEFEVAACLPVPDMRMDQSAVRAHAEQLQESLQEVVDNSAVDCGDMHFTIGKPAREINRLVDRYKARMILVGRGVRKGPKGFVLGNTAERILARSNTDVLVVP